MTQSLPRRDELLEVLRRRTRPLTARELAARLQVAEGSFAGFARFVDALAQEGALRLVDGDRYALEGAPGSGDAGSGELVGGAPDDVGPAARDARRGGERVGVLRVDELGQTWVHAPSHGADLLVPEARAGGALRGDKVLARPVSTAAGRVEGEVLEVVSRGTHRVTGVLRRRGASAWVEPDDPRLRGPLVLRGELWGVDGDAAVAQVTRFAELADENPEGELVAAHGKRGDPHVEVTRVLLREGFDEAPPARAIAEADEVAADARRDEAGPRATDPREHEDFTAVPFVTIDPDETFCPQFAVCVERGHDGSFTAWLAITDVGRVVRPGSAIDDAARARGRSLRLPDRVVPMLPPELEPLVALQPGAARACLCVVARFDASGVLLESRIARGVARSAARLTHVGVARALGLAQRGPRQRVSDTIVERLRDADALARVIGSRRGAIELPRHEPRFACDPSTGAPLSASRRGIEPGSKRVAQMVDELRLVAEEAAATLLGSRGVEAIYRVHPAPDAHALGRLAALVEGLGLAFDPGSLDPASTLAAASRGAAAHPGAAALVWQARRALGQGSFDVTNRGHFVVASAACVPMTSPVDRHVDLAMQRLVASMVEAEARGLRLDQGREEEIALADAARQATARDRLAHAIEREVILLFGALCMSDRIGDTLLGTIVDVSTAGALVTLDNPFVDVLVRPEALGRDDYVLDGERSRFVGQRTGDAVAPGDRVTITIESASLERRLVLAWRHAPHMADHEPLRHAPFRAPARAHDPKGPDARASRGTPGPDATHDPKAPPRQRPAPRASVDAPTAAKPRFSPMVAHRAAGPKRRR